MIAKVIELQPKSVRNALAGILLTAFLSEAIYVLHTVIFLRERMAIVEAKIDLILYEKKHYPEPELDMSMVQAREDD